jgi:hypothetical protein
MTDERAEYLASASGPQPADRDRLDLIRGILADDETWSEPPPDVADRLLAAIVSERARFTEAIPTHPRRRAWLAAAVLGLVALTVVVSGFLGVFSPPEQQVIAMQGTELEPTATGQAAIRESGGGWWIGLEVDLPAASSGTYYEGWMWNDSGDGVSIGTFHLRGDKERVVLWSGVSPASYPSIWVTLEDEDGDPTASDRVVMRGSAADG